MKPSVTVYSFGLRTMVRPPEAVDLNINCLGIVNPHYVPEERIEALLEETPEVRTVLGKAITSTLTALQTRDRIAVGVFCAYGRHRSPFVATRLSTALAALGVDVQLQHCNKGAA